MSLHHQKTVAKKRSIALYILLAIRTVMLPEDVDMVAGDVNGAHWQTRSGPHQPFDCTLEEAFNNAELPVPPGPTPWWCP